MAHFYGELQGNRGRASRLGTKDSGLSMTAASWQGAVAICLSYDEKTGVDWATVSICPWHGQGISKLLYDGPVSGLISPVSPVEDPDPVIRDFPENKPLFDLD